MNTQGTLYLLATPIGNPDDITLRALDVLRSVSLIAAEDTRHTKTLLRAHTIGLSDKHIVSCNDHNEHVRVDMILDVLRSGGDVALVSDAGTPLVNDPGFRVVNAVVDAGFAVSPLPGASAPIAALIGSGLPVHRFLYVGFLSRKSPKRRGELRRIATVDASLVLFEAPHRLLDTVKDLHDVLGDRPAVLARNLTKKDELFSRGSLSELVAELETVDVIRGEYTIVVAPAQDNSSSALHELSDRITTAMLTRGASPKLTSDVVAEVTELPRNQVYQRVQELAESLRTT